MPSKVYSVYPNPDTKDAEYHPYVAQLSCGHLMYMRHKKEESIGDHVDCGICDAHPKEAPDGASQENNNEQG